MNQQEQIVISAATVERVVQSPRLFPEVVMGMAAPDLERMRQVRNVLHELVKTAQSSPEMVE